MRNGTLNNNYLFESILDDVGQSDVNVSSLADSTSVDDTQIDYERYQYEVRIYFARGIKDYEWKHFITVQLPLMHEHLTNILDNSRLFTSVSPVRFKSLDKEKLEEYADVAVIRDWTDPIDTPWAYTAWTAVFCCDMPLIRNIPHMLNFLAMIESLATKTYLCSGMPIVSFRQNDVDVVTFWTNQMTYTVDVVKNKLYTDKPSNKKRSEYMSQYYLQMAKLSSNTGILIARTLTNYFKIDWAPILFEKSVKQYITTNDMEKTGQRVVKLSNKTKNFLSTMEVSTAMFNRMQRTLQVYSFKFTDTTRADEFYIDATHWGSVKTLWEETKKHPLPVLSWEMKTINANLDYIVMFYLGMFDRSLYVNTDEDNTYGKSEPVHLMLVSSGQIAVDAIETKFREMFGNRFLPEVCDDIINALFANANRE